jgi:hypothetical protein
LSLQEIAVLAHHTYPSDAPESRALRSAFIWAALIVSMVALVLLNSGKARAFKNSEQPVAASQEKSSLRHDIGATSQSAGGLTTASTDADSDLSQSLSASIRATAYLQNKPPGSIFMTPIHVAQ